MPYLVVANVSIDPKRARHEYYRTKEQADVSAETYKSHGTWVSGPTHVARVPHGNRYAYSRKTEAFAQRNLRSSQPERFLRRE